MKKVRRFRHPVTITVSGKCIGCDKLMVTAYNKTHATLRCPSCGEFRGVFVTTTSAPTVFGVEHTSL